MTSRMVILGLLTVSQLAGCDIRTTPQPTKIFTTAEKTVSPLPEPEDPTAPFLWSSSKYFDLHSHIFRAELDLWQPAVAALEQKGDRFTLAMVELAQKQQIAPEKQAALEKLSAALRPKYAALAPEEVQLLLERDAYADMMCPTIEFNLRDWTRDFLASQAHRPEIRQELERLEKSYICDEKILELEKSFAVDPGMREMEERMWSEKVQFNQMNSEVKDRAASLLVKPESRSHL